jgi:hypothetical protein
MQLLVVYQARCKQLPTVSRGMLRLVLLARGVRLSLMMSEVKCAMRGFWGATLADAQCLRLELHCATDQCVQQLATGAPGGTLPGVMQLRLRVSLLNVHDCACLCPANAGCCHWLQGGSFSSAALECFPSLQCLRLNSETSLQLSDSPWTPMPQLQRLVVVRAACSTALPLTPVLQAAMGLQLLVLSGIGRTELAALGPALQQLTGLQQL